MFEDPKLYRFDGRLGGPMFQASEERRLQIGREKQYRTNRQHYLREFRLCLGWDETRDRCLGRGHKFCISGTTKQMCTRMDTAQVLCLADKLLGWGHLLINRKVVPLASSRSINLCWYRD